MSVELLLEVSSEQDLLLQELVETYTSTVGLLLVQKGELPAPKDLNCNLKKSHLKNRAIADAWLMRNSPERHIEFPSFRMNGCSYHITRKNVLVFRSFVFQGMVDFIFRIQLQGDQIKKDRQGVLTLFKNQHGWIVKIEPKRISNRERKDTNTNRFRYLPLFDNIIW